MRTVVLLAWFWRGIGLFEGTKKGRMPNVAEARDECALRFLSRETTWDNGRKRIGLMDEAARFV